MGDLCRRVIVSIFKRWLIRVDKVIKAEVPSAVEEKQFFEPNEHGSADPKSAGLRHNDKIDIA